MENLALFSVLDAKLAYISQCQNVLANNIANANTPGFKPSEVNAPDFKKILDGQSGSSAVALTATSPNHIGAQTIAYGGENIKIAPSFYEVTPSGNGVDLEEQMIKASKNQGEANMAINMYVKQLSMLRTAIGAGGR